MTNFNQRSSKLELMDDLDFADQELDLVLKELRFINKWLGGNALTIKGLDGLIKSVQFNESKKLKIVDLGCGGGDMLLLIAKWAKKRNINVELIGVDANEYIIEYAKKRTKLYPEISFMHANIFGEKFSNTSFDIVTCTLFTHHFTNDQLVKMFESVHKVKMGWVINDLHRHWLAYYLIKYLTKLFSKSYMVKNDAPLSVARSFRKSDWQSILKRSGLNQFTIKWKWAFRWELLIRTTA